MISPSSRPAAALVVLALGVAAAACAPEPVAPTTRPSGTASETPAPTTAPTTAAPVPADTRPSLTATTGVVATGTFETVLDGETVTGAVEVSRAARSGVSFVTLEMTGAPDEAVIRLSATADGPCVDSRMYDYGALRYVPDGTPRALPATQPFEDATVWTRIVLGVPGDNAGAGCETSIVASAPLEWTVSSPRSALAGLVDGGSRPGAEGEVTASGGRAYEYRVARGDVMVAVADRFGVAVADLLALNPFRSRPSDPGLYAEEILNLDITAR